MAEGASRPVLITVLGVLKIIGAIILIIAGILGGTFIAEIIQELYGNWGALTGGIIGGTLVVSGIIELVLAIGFFKGWKIVWYITVILYVVNAVMGILSFPAGLIGTAIYIILVWYFFRPEVKDWFGLS